MEGRDRMACLAAYREDFFAEMARGSHFAAVDTPELFLEDVRAFFRELR